MPINRLINTKNNFSHLSSGEGAYKANSYNCSNATSKVVSLNGTWKTDSISFTVDPLYRYTVHVRNSASFGTTSINIDFIEVYGEASASYLTCTEDSAGYRFGFNGQEKDNEITGVEGSHNTAEFWMYDTRLGRRWNVDPVDQISISNYACFGGNPIENIDVNGDFKTKFGARWYKFWHGIIGKVKQNEEKESDKFGEWYIYSINTKRIYHSKPKAYKDKDGTKVDGLDQQVVTCTIVYDKVNKSRGGIEFYSKSGIGRDKGNGDYGLPSHRVNLDDWLNPTNGVEKSKKFFKSIIERISDANEALERGESLSNDENLGKKSNRIHTTTFPDSLDKEYVNGIWVTFPKNSNDTVQTYLVDPDRVQENGKTLLEIQNEAKKK